MLNAQRPLLIFGAGVRGCVRDAEKLRKATGIPLVVTWAVRDLFPDAMGFGTHGHRAANFAVQTADYVLAIGTRLDTKATGSPASSFAPNARLVMVDVDQSELDKMAKIGRQLSKAHRSDAWTFIRKTLEQKNAYPDWSEWKAKIADWRDRFGTVKQNTKAINPYALVDTLSELMVPDDVLVSDTGCGLAWLMQAFKFKGQKFVHAFNNTPMGYGLPAAVGASFATKRRVVLVTGDGGLGVNVTEFATVARHGLEIKVVLLNNKGHAMCRQTQKQWLGGEFPGTSYKGGLATPDFVRIAEAYNIPARSISESSQIGYGLRGLLYDVGPGLLECSIPVDAGVEPMVRFGKSLEHADPALPNVDEILAESTECATTE